jgi:uncharacterized phage protein (TIGR01671 family)
MVMIECRGKIIGAEEEWIIGCLCYTSDNAYIVYDDDFYPSESLGTERLMSDRFFRIQRETIGRYTGLKDNNGEKIFEGDFVMRCNTESNGIENEIMYLVAFENGAFVMKRKDSYYPYRFAYEGYSLHKDYSMLQQFKKEAPWTNGSYEVIGNIHDNPEFLEANA